MQKPLELFLFPSQVLFVVFAIRKLPLLAQHHITHQYVILT